MRHNGLRAVDPAAVATIATRRVGTAPPRGSAPEPARWGRQCPGVAASGHSGAGHGHPHGRAPHDTSDESGGPAERRGGARSGAAPDLPAARVHSSVVSSCRTGDRRSVLLAWHGRSPIRRFRQFPALTPTAGRVGRKPAVLCHAKKKRGAKSTISTRRSGRPSESIGYARRFDATIRDRARRYRRCAATLPPSPPCGRASPVAGGRSSRAKCARTVLRVALARRTTSTLSTLSRWYFCNRLSGRWIRRRIYPRQESRQVGRSSGGLEPRVDSEKTGCNPPAARIPCTSRDARADP